MRNATHLDHMLENAVAEALGVELPHPESPKRVRASRPRPSRRQVKLLKARREHRAAA
ncbi:MAG: hypothetical protein ACTHOR_01345 [Devosia sp.]|jgi:hypothetical protein|nr:hypothetical protein [Devosiaceae bacterium]